MHVEPLAGKELRGWDSVTKNRKTVNEMRRKKCNLTGQETDLIDEEGDDRERTLKPPSTGLSRNNLISESTSSILLNIIRCNS